MFYDLDVRIDRQGRGKAIQTLSRLGYDVIAFTTTISDVKKLGPEHLPQRRTLQEADKFVRPTRFHTNPVFRKKEVVTLERVTIVVNDTSQLGLLSSRVLNEYDLVAVCPTSEKLFQQCLQFDFDIISLTLDRRQHFQVKRPQVHVAAEKGMTFEITYAAGLRDVDSRRFLVSNAGSICRATGGKHLIMSSGARNVMELRGPHDVMNLGILFDIPQEHSRHAVTSVAEETVAHGDTRARAFKGIVRVEDLEESEVDQPSPQAMET